MSEYTDPDYRSEFEAPPYTIIDRQVTAETIVTTVVIDGEIAVFEVNAVVHQLGKQAARPLNERFYELIERLDRE